MNIIYKIIISLNNRHKRAIFINLSLINYPDVYGILWEVYH